MGVGAEGEWWWQEWRAEGSYAPVIVMVTLLLSQTRNSFAGVHSQR